MRAWLLCFADHCVLMHLGQSEFWGKESPGLWPHPAPVFPVDSEGEAVLGARTLLHIRERRRIICETPVLETMERGDREKERIMVMSSQGRLFAVSLVGADPCLSRGPHSGMWGFRQASETWLGLWGAWRFCLFLEKCRKQSWLLGLGSELSLRGTGTGELSPPKMSHISSWKTRNWTLLGHG